MNGTLRRVVMSLSLPAISCVNVSPSITHGPAMRKNGRSMPTWKLASNTGSPGQKVSCGGYTGRADPGQCLAGQSRGGRSGPFQGMREEHRTVVVQRHQELLERLLPSEITGLRRNHVWNSRLHHFEFGAHRNLFESHRHFHGAREIRIVEPVGVTQLLAWPKLQVLTAEAVAVAGGKIGE